MNKTEHLNTEQEPARLFKAQIVGIYPLPCPVCRNEMVYVVSVRTINSVDDYCYCYACKASVVISQYILKDEGER
jgi:hypothetical protein